MLISDRPLAIRLEQLVAIELRRFAATALALSVDGSAACADVAGGAALFVGTGSPVNQASGCGMAGPVEAGEIDRLEMFFRDRGALPLVNLCPLADPSFVAALAARGFVASGFENVLARQVIGGDIERLSVRSPADEAIEIRNVSSAEERTEWAGVAAEGFSAPEEPDSAQLELARIVAARPEALLLLAYVDGKPAGTGELVCEDSVAWLSADATLPQFRGRGVQTALQRERLRIAAKEGCELAVTESTPGSASQRNMHRHGFVVLYTRVDLIGPASVSGRTS